MGELIYKGLQKSAESAPQEISILMGQNLRNSSASSSEKPKKPEKARKEKQVK